MDVEKLADHVIGSAQNQRRYIIAIAGPPGAGKSTLADQLHIALKQRSVRSRVIPMDGFHLDNSILTQRGLLARKGSPPTFDTAGFVHLMKRLADGEDGVVIPTFDRERDISIAGADIIGSDDSILIVEGNYLLIKDQPWSKLQEVWNETVLINPGMSVLENRLIERWIRHGLAPGLARERALGNDIPNAQFVLENSAPANIKIV